MVSSGLQQLIKMNEIVQYKVVFQLSSNDNAVYKSLISQLKNLLAAMDNVKVEVVINSLGIEFIDKDSVFESQILELMMVGVTFVICNNTLNSNNKTMEDIISGVQVVPAVVAHLVKRQYEGWAYIKAGF